MTDDGLPLVLFNSKIPNNGLGKDQSSQPAAIVFDNPQQDRFAPSLTVLTQANRPPQFTTAPPVTAVVGRAYRYAVAAIDPDGSLGLTYQLTSGPSGMTIDSSTGFITWTPTATDVGATDIAIQVQDARGGQATQSYTLTALLNQANRPPVFITAPVVSAAPLANYQYPAATRDIDEDTVTYSLTQFPSGMTIDSGTGLVRYPNAVAGTYPVTIVANDGRGGTATQEFTLFVGSAPNRTAPLITSVPPVVAYIGATYVYTISVTDTASQSLQFQLLQAPTGMTISPTGRITWQPQASQVGLQNVRVQVTNGSGGIAAQSFSIEAIAQRPNQGPQFTSAPQRVATVDQDYLYTAVATDPEQSALTYSLAVFPAGMTIDAQSGAIQWKPSPSQLGPQRILINAVDPQGLRATQAFAIDVRPVNTAPTFVTTTITDIMAGDAYRYNALATDLEDAVTYSLAAGPTTGLNAMQIDPRSGSITWQPKSADVGSYPIIIRATDDRGATTDQSFTLTVNPDRRAPTISIQLQQSTINVGDTTRIDVRAYDASGLTSVSLSIDGQVVALDAADGYLFTATSSGIPNIVATAVDRAGNVGTASPNPVLRVLDANDTQPPIVQLTAPAAGSTVTYLTDIVGTITDPNLEYFELQYALAGSDQWTTFASRLFRPGAGGNGIVNGNLGVFDPTMLANDTYQVRAVAQDTNGAQSIATIELSVESQAKIGNYRYDAIQRGCSQCQASYFDLEVSVAGIPIRIMRSYDTLDAGFIGDFGYGWRMEVTNPRIREGVRISASELAGAGPLTANPFRMGTRVYMNAPDGRRIGFTFNPVPVAGLLGTVWTPEFTPDPGVEYQLEVEKTPLSQTADGAFGLYLLQLPYNPDRYTLVSKDQIRFSYNQFSDLQLESQTDRNGVQLTYTRDGIFSNVGPQVTWTRDAQGRITSITDPAGRILRYTYDDAGDLVAFTNQAGEVTQMTYLSDPAHFLESVTDARGIKMMQLTYDDDHRMIGLSDADGKPEKHDYDLENNTESIVDRAGNTTVLVFDDRGNITQVTDPLGHSFTAEFNADDMPVRLTDQRGFTTTMVYDDRSNITQVTDALGHIWKTTYNANNDRTSTTDPQGNKLTFDYDTRGNLVSTVDGLGRRNKMVVDNRGRTTELTNPAGQTWIFSFDNFDSPSRITNPDETFRDVQLDNYGDMIGITEENNVSYSFTRDEVGRVIAMSLVTAPISSSSASASASRNTPLTSNTESPISRNALASGSSATATDDRNALAAGSSPSSGTSISRNALASGSSASATDDRNALAAGSSPSSGTSISRNALASGSSSSARNSDEQPQYFALMPAFYVEQEIDALGRVTRYEYNNIGHRAKMIDPLGGVYDFQFDSNYNLTSQTDSRGNTTKYEYDANNRLTKVTNAVGASVTYEYDEAGNLIQETDPAGFVTKHTYDGLNRRTSTTLPDGSIVSADYDEIGRVIRSVGPRGEISRFAYDAGHQLTGMIDPMQGVYAWDYDLSGNVTTYTDPRGNQTKQSFNERNRLVSRTDALGFIEQFEYDGIGRVKLYTDQVGSTTSYAYDPLGRMIDQTNSDGGIYHYDYDAVGNQIAARDPLGRTTTSTYDALDRLVTSTDPRGFVTTLQYDAMSNMVSLTDASQNTTRWAYDKLNRVSTRTDPLGGIETFKYDDQGVGDCSCRGNLVESTDRLGRKIEYGYDSRNRNTSIRWLDANGNVVDTITQQFDASNNLTAISDSDSSLAFTYDLNSRLITSDNLGTPGARRTVLTNTWDATGNRTRVEDNDGVRVDSVYDARDLLIARTWSGMSTSLTIAPVSSTMQYNGRGQLTELLRHADADQTQLISKTKRTYDSVGRSRQISHLSAIDAVMAQFDTEWDTANQLTKWTIDYPSPAASTQPDALARASHTTTFEYDSTGQLTKAQRIPRGSAVPTTPDELYTYDATGNRTASSTTPTSQNIGPNNRLRSDSRYAYTYDAEGNLVDRLEIATGIHDRYEYDHANRMIHHQRESSSGQVLSAVEYRYDALGRRIARTVDLDGPASSPATTEYFIYDGMDVWSDTDTAGNITARYLHGDNIDEPLARYRPGEGISWYLSDHLGSIRVLINNTGSIIDLIDYDSFGNILSESSPEFGDRYKYTGREWDADLGLYYYRSRLYSPTTGRFTTDDPIGFLGGQVNLSAYVGNSPTSFTDPLGWSAVAEGTMAYNYSMRVQSRDAGAAVGGLLGFACGFVEGWYRTGDVKEALYSGSIESVVGIYAGAAVGYVGASKTVWVRYVTGILGIAAGALSIANSDNPTTANIRTTCGLIGLGIGTASYLKIKAISRQQSGKQCQPNAIPSEFEHELARGGSYIMTEEQYLLYAKGKQFLGRSDGQFMTSASEMNKIIQETGGDPMLIAKRLGLQNITPETVLIRMDVTDPLKFNPRLPSSSMSGANALFVPGGKTIGGVPEIVTDPLPCAQVWATPIRGKQ